MEQAIEGPADLHAAFPRMHDGETAYYIADAWFVDRARELAGAVTRARAICRSTANVERDPVRHNRADTRRPERSLDGSADRMQLCGIDRWLGGVHVCTAAARRGAGGARSGHLIEA